MTATDSRLITVAGVTVILTPAFWLLGLDQAAWLIAALTLGIVWLRHWRQPFLQVAAVAGVFLATLLVSGVLGAEGVRWVTLTREFLIVSAFFGALLGVAVIANAKRLGTVLLALLAVITISSGASLVAFVFEAPLRFTTPIAPFVPSIIAETGLGAQSLTERSLAETSYFLGESFLRPQGLFLFSTSQAVAQSMSIPLFLIAARRYPRTRNWCYVGISLTTLALVVSTTRTPIAALAIAGASVWLVRTFQRGELTIRLSLRGRSLISVISLGVIAAAVMAGSGLLQPVTNLLSTRSLEGRTSLYEMTVDAWARQPVLGFGTEVDWTPTPQPSVTSTPTPTPSPTPTPTPSMPLPAEPPELPPLGSHSWYLGVLFKQGLVGLAALLALLGIIATCLVRFFRSSLPESGLTSVAVITVMLTGTTESLWLDPATALFAAVALGVSLGKCQSADIDSVST